MLILTRKPSETLVIGEQGSNELIHVSILSVTGNQVKIGVDAPSKVKVARQEIQPHIFR